MTTPDEDLGKIFMRTGDLYNPPRHFVMGDSHSLFFAGAEQLLDTHAVIPSAHEGYRVFYIGPGLAASLVKPRSTNRTREKITMALEEVRACGARHVIFSFGEIDCRFHIRQRAEKAGGAHPEAWLLSTRVTVMKYMAFLLEMKLTGLLPIVWGPPPTTPSPPESHAWITLGTMQERNFITRHFTDMLRSEASRAGIPVLSLFHDLVDAQLCTQPGYSADNIHLSQRFWPLWQEQCRKIGLEP